MSERTFTVNIQANNQANQSVNRLNQNIDKARGNTQRLGNSAQRAQQQFDGLVGEGTGRKLTRLNEKTEKARQLMGAFGGAVGGAAGQVVYYGGTISSIIGGFSRFELGAIGIVGAIAAIGVAMWNAANKEVEEFKKRFEETNKEIETTKESVEALLIAHRQSVAGLDQYQKKNEEVEGVISKLNMEIEDLTLAMRKAAKENNNFLATASDSTILNTYLRQADATDELAVSYNKLVIARDGFIRQSKQLLDASDAEDNIRNERLVRESQERAAAEAEAKAKARRQKAAADRDASRKKWLADFKMDKDAAIKEIDQMNKNVEDVQDVSNRLFEEAMSGVDRMVEANQDRAETIMRNQEEFASILLKNASDQADETREQFEIGMQLTAAAAQTLATEGVHGLFAYLQGVLTSLAIESGVRALFETAMGLAAEASLQFGVAKVHFASAATFAKTAALAGAGAAVSAGLSAVTAGSGSSDDVGTTANVANGGGGGGGEDVTNIVVYGNWIDSENGDRQIAKAQARYTGVLEEGRYQRSL
jgi:hypothetical protein